MKTRSITLTVLLSAAPLLPPGLCAQQTDGYSAWVAPSRAVFTFPVPFDATWEWQLEDTPNGTLEYAWSVNVENHGSAYEFGFFRFQHGRGTGVFSGALPHLLEAGQRSVWMRTEEGAKLVPVLEPTVRAETAQLVVELTDSALVGSLFTGSPTHVRLRAVLPRREAVEITVAVTYAASAPAQPGLWIEAEHVPVTPFAIPRLGAAGDVEPLAASHGRAVVLLFWEPSCDICTAELRALARFASEWDEPAVSFFAAAVRDTAAARILVGAPEFASVAHLTGSFGLLGRLAGAAAPYLVVLDEDRRVVFRRHGACPYAPPLAEDLNPRLLRALNR